MILEIEVENLFSFKDKVTFDLNSNIVNITGSSNSGKTNLLKILNAVSLMIRNVNNYDSIPFSTYMFTNSLGMFKITFIINNIKYTYGFIGNKNIIDKEYLYYYDEEVETLIYNRDRNNYTFDDKKLRTITNKVLSNRLFLSYCKDYDKLKDVYTFLTSTIGVCLDVRSLIDLAFKLYTKDANNKLKPYILNFYKNINVNIIDYNVKSVMLEKETGYTTKFKHKIDNKNYIIDYGDESLSNRLVFAIIPFLIISKEEKILIIDDLDSYLDDKIIKEIISMFNNSKGQLVFSTHNNKYNCKSVRLD